MELAKYSLDFDAQSDKEVGRFFLDFDESCRRFYPCCRMISLVVCNLRCRKPRHKVAPHRSLLGRDEVGVVGCR